MLSSAKRFSIFLLALVTGVFIAAAPACSLSVDPVVGDGDGDGDGVGNGDGDGDGSGDGLDAGEETDASPIPVAMLSADPQGLDFGETEQGMAVPNQIVTFKATGGSVTLGNVSVTGALSSAGTDTCSNIVLGDGNQCQVSVNFPVNQTGTRVGTLDLSGKTVAADIRVLVPGILSAATVAFGDVMAEAVETKSATIQNSGEVTVAGIAAVISQGGNRFAIDTENCPNDLAPGASCQIEIEYRPVYNNGDAGKLRLTYNGSKQLEVNLTGTGSGTFYPLTLNAGVFLLATPGTNGSPNTINCGPGSCTFNYLAGKVVMLEAPMGSTPPSWNGCTQQSDLKKCNVTMTSMRTVTANP